MLKPLSIEQKRILRGERPGMLPLRFARLWHDQGFDISEDDVQKHVRPPVSARPVMRCTHLGEFITREACSCGSSEKIAVHNCNKMGRKCVPHGHGLLVSTDLKAGLVDCLSCPHMTTRRKRRDRFSTAFVAEGVPRFITSAQMQEDIKLLVSKLPSDITAIAGVARSGLAAATMVSMYTHLPMLTIRQTKNDVVATGNGWRIGGNRHIDPATEKVAVVDDTVMTGNSFSALQPLLESTFKNYVRCAVYVNPKAKIKPDIWAIDLGWPHLLEWNLFNSVLSPNMACDFDGILCRDCPPGSDDDGPRYLEFIRNAQPLYLPRKVPIPLIVTARIEKYRAETEGWLERHGIKCDRLIMHQAKTLADRQRDDIAAFKARRFDRWAKKHLATPPPLAFIESEDWQARAIHEKTGRMTICPAAAKVYS